MAEFVQNIIIGAGPAGIATAIQLSRYGLNFKIFESSKIGGLLNNANLVENYLGIYPPISGKALIEIFKKQLEYNNIKIDYENVTNVTYQICFNRFSIKTNLSDYFCSNLIIACGTLPKVPEFEVANNATPFVFCEIDGICNAEGKSIAIIGSGDAAFDYAINLSKRNKVKILARNNSYSALPLLIERAKNNPNIEIIDNLSVSRIDYDKNIIIETNKKNISADFAIIAIGRKPNDELIQNIDNAKELINTNRLFVIGDIANGIYRQATISAAQGLQAAMTIYMNKTESNK